MEDLMQPAAIKMRRKRMSRTTLKRLTSIPAHKIRHNNRHFPAGALVGDKGGSSSLAQLKGELGFGSTKSLGDPDEDEDTKLDGNDNGGNDNGTNQGDGAGNHGGDGDGAGGNGDCNDVPTPPDPEAPEEGGSPSYPDAQAGSPSHQEARQDPMGGLPEREQRRW